MFIAICSFSTGWISMDEYDALFLSSRGVQKEQDLSRSARGGCGAVASAVSELREVTNLLVLPCSRIECI